MDRLRRSRAAVALLLAYGLLTTAFAIVLLVLHLSVIQTVQGVLFVIIGLLAVAAGAVRLRARRQDH